MNDTIETGFELTTEQPKIIKVIGIGGGGGNAVSHMYRKGIHDVTFLLCNTDSQDLQKSPVPDKLTLGTGRGAGGIPETALNAAKVSEDDIRRRLDDGTQMVFITAGMGGGTGTGAAPFIAGIAKSMGILTVGIVTIPFTFEGYDKIMIALAGVENIRKNVDALLVIKNDKIFEVFDEETPRKIAFAKADDTLYTASKSIADLITFTGDMNIDFADVQTNLQNSGVALISNGRGDGRNRLKLAIEDAIASPLLNNNDIFNAKRLLLNIAHSEEHDLVIREMREMEDFMLQFDQRKIHTKWGNYIDNTLGSEVIVTILASGFSRDAIPGLTEFEGKKTEYGNISEEEKATLLNRYGYTKEISSTHFQSYILSTEELDSDEIIALLEDYPTYKRDQKIFTDYKTRRNKTTTPRPSSPNNTSTERGRSTEVITF
jgi:cell division protein FtsZ